MNTNEFKEIVDRAREYDEDALRILYEQTNKQAYFFTRKFLKNEYDIYDVLQEAYIKAFRSLDQLDDGSNFIKWFSRIVANTCKDFLRKRKTLSFCDLEEEDAWIDIKEERHEFSPNESLDYKELRKALLQIIEDLSEDQRLCMLMYYYDQLEIKEIAETLEVSENTVKSRLRYARGHMQEAIEELDRKGTKLYNVALIPFLLWMLQQERDALCLPPLFTKKLPHSIQKGKLPSKIHKKWFHLSHHIFFKIMVSLAVSIGAVVGGYLYYDSQQIHFDVVFQEDIAVEYGKELTFDSIIATVNQEPFHEQPDEQGMLTYDNKDLTILLEVGVSQLGEQQGTLRIRWKQQEQIHTFTYQVVDLIAPVLTISENEVKLMEGDEFDPLSYIQEAMDNVDGDLKEQITIENPVDTAVPDTYTVSYMVKDSSGNTTTAEMQVVIEKKPEEKPVQQVAKTSNTNQTPASAPAPTPAPAFDPYQTDSVVAQRALSGVGKKGNCTSLVAYATGYFFPQADAEGFGPSIPIEQAVPGDLVFYKDNGMGGKHIAIYVGNGQAVHGGWEGDNIVINTVYLPTAAAPIFMHMEQ